MRKLFHAFYTVIEKHEGTIIETTGDGLYAIFSLNKNIQENTEASIKSGFEILEQLDQMSNDYFLKNFGQRIEIGIGIHAGTVVAGHVKLGDEKHLLVMGYPVNVASRLQNATKELNNNFIVSAEAFNHSTRSCIEHPVTTVQLKGLSEPMSVHLMGKPYANGIV